MTPVSLAVGLVWMALGLFGAFSYTHNYLVYRGFNPPRDPPQVARGRLLEVPFYSRAMRQRRKYLIYLPAGYGAGGQRGARYPVLYLLHGSPGWPKQFIDIARAGVIQDVLMAARQVRPFLMVMIDGRDGSYTSDTEWADTGHGRYASLVLDAVRAVDARWPTAPGRASRAIAGNSEGAYGAMNVALHQLATFGVVEAWSGYYLQRRAGPFKRATTTQLRENSPAAYVGSLGPNLRRWPLHAFVYTGRTDEARDQSRAFAKALATVGANVSFAVDSGRHDWRLWRAQMPDMLRYADRWVFARPGT
jgi:enterochelin esterase-like enzyme